MEYEIVMGLEVHVELSTKTKIFCGCSTEFGGEPNSHTCPVCMGMPGSLPVLNKGVVDRAIKAGLAFHSDLQYTNIFDRKNYFYPDLPKDYQISQLYSPICLNGYIEIEHVAPGQDLDEYGMIRDAGAYDSGSEGVTGTASGMEPVAPGRKRKMRENWSTMRRERSSTTTVAACLLWRSSPNRISAAPTKWWIIWKN